MLNSTGSSRNELTYVYSSSELTFHDKLDKKKKKPKSRIYGEEISSSKIIEDTSKITQLNTKFNYSTKEHVTNVLLLDPKNEFSHETISDKTDSPLEVNDNRIFKHGIELLDQQYLESILLDQKLKDIHIDKFNEILKKTTDYKPQGSYLVQKPWKIKPINKDETHIEILHSYDGENAQQLGHWVCSYYNGQYLYIYDSLNLQNLHVHHKTYLERLYPFLSLDSNLIKFPKNQSQVNGVDCGVHAIANAVSLYFNICPDSVNYDIS